MTTLKRHPQAWGEEVVIGDGARVVRIYSSAKKVTIDLTQVRDTTWNVYQAVTRKYPGTSRIELAADTDVNKLISFFMGSTKATEDKPIPALSPTLVAVMIEGILSMVLNTGPSDAELRIVSNVQTEVTRFMMSLGPKWWDENEEAVDHACTTLNARNAVSEFVEFCSSL
jgi:hypothetical protein